MRTSTRKSTSRTARYPISRKTFSKMWIKPRKKAAKKKAAKKKTAAPTFAPKVKLMMKNLNSFIAKRRKEFGKNDPLAKSLSNIHSTLNKEFKKINALNPNFVRALKKINPSLRGRGPASLRKSIPAIAKHLREFVKKGTKQFLSSLTKILNPMSRELNKLEKTMNSQIKKAKSSKTQLKVNPALKRRFNTLNNKITKFKKNWTKRLNTLALHGNQEVKRAVKNIKKQLDECQKTTRRNLTILNRYAKSQKKKAGHKIKPLFTASQAKSFESQFKKIKAQCEKTRSQIEQFATRLKSIKLF